MQNKTSEEKQSCTVDVVIHRLQLCVLQLPKWNDTASSLVLLEKEKGFWLYLPGVVFWWCAGCCILVCVRELASLVHLTVVCP